ncbi:hypothetical protein KAU11_05000, partial [Candidatus Babeliales bacterium]|nr:hypothetical protein [Candidatus Babeliales bacterium]
MNEEEFSRVCDEFAKELEDRAKKRSPEEIEKQKELDEEFEKLYQEELAKEIARQKFKGFVKKVLTYATIPFWAPLLVPMALEKTHPDDCERIRYLKKLEKELNHEVAANV